MAAVVPNQFAPAMQVNSISLSVLIDHMIQRTYHDLTVLSELLPRKTDMERKMETAQFASRTRQMFVRLLALVKWASSTSKVDKCAMISNFLDQQAMLFTETADMLARMARETLVGARLPAFSIPCAVDVLTTGSYPRLPACIREKILPPDPITPQEKTKTLRRLNQIIEYRLVSSELPARLKRPEIRNGRVIFTVENEFCASVTVMGDKPDIPWRLLDIDILVEDPEVGDSMALVHSLQVGYIHELAQCRLLDAERPLHELYDMLHSFCQSLQLEVLFTQAQRLIAQRMGDALKVEEYRRGQKLVLSYWKEQQAAGAPFQPSYKLCICVDETDASLPLQVMHTPQLTQDLTKISQPINSRYLSVERLLVGAMQRRGILQLQELERELRLLTPGPPQVRGVPSALHAPLLYPPLEHEGLTVMADMQTGKLLVALGVYTETDLTKEIQNSLNGDRRKLRPLLSNLRLWLALERCRRSAEQLPASSFRQLPLCNLSSHPLSKLSQNRIFIRLPSHNQHYLVIEAKELSRRVIEHHYYLLEVLNLGAPPSINNEDSTPASDGQNSDPRLYMKAGNLIALDKFMCTHSTGTKLFEVEPEDPILLNRKRKLFRQTGGPRAKKRRAPRGMHSLPDLPHMIAQCENRLPLVLLACELEQNDIKHSDITVNEDNGCVQVLLQGLPQVAQLKQQTCAMLKKGFLGGCIQAFWNGSSQPCWLMEVLFCDNPVKDLCQVKPGPVQRAQFSYTMCSLQNVAKTVDILMGDWQALAKLYELVCELAAAYKTKSHFQREIQLLSYDLKRLKIAYGPKFEYVMAVSCDAKSKQFKLNFACHSDIATCNGHEILSLYLQRMLNDNHSIVNLMQVLLDTWHPLRSLARLHVLPRMAVAFSTNQITASFLVLPQSPTHIHLSFRHEYALDIHFKPNRRVTVRDAAYGTFDTTKVQEGLTPIKGLKNFLTLYMDPIDSSRRRSTTEDDHPPSPENTDMFFDSFFGASASPMGAGLSTSGGLSAVGKRAADMQAGFKGSITSPSNPLNPTSPANVRYQSQQPHPSPGVNFPLTSPPSVGNMMGPSPSMMAPSPSNPMAPSPMAPSPLGISMQSPAMNMLSQSAQDIASCMSPADYFPFTMTVPGHPYYPASLLLTKNLAKNAQVTVPTMVKHDWDGKSTMALLLLLFQHLKCRGSNPASMQQPQRSLPQRFWAASVPIVLSHAKFERLMTPGLLPGSRESKDEELLCPLERFLASVSLRRCIHRVVTTEVNKMIVLVPGPDASTLQLKTMDGLILTFGLSGQMLNLFLKVSTVNEASQNWTQEELHTLEKFFEAKVSHPPYRLNAAHSFMRLMSLPMRFLKEIIKIMKADMIPEPNQRWLVNFCMTMPYNTPIPDFEPGPPAVVCKDKLLIILQLRGNAGTQVENDQVVLPVLYVINDNATKLVIQTQPTHPLQQRRAQDIVAPFNNFTPTNVRPIECTLFPAIYELMMNL